MAICDVTLRSMAKSAAEPAKSQPNPAPTVTARVVIHEGHGWSLYELSIPQDWLAEAKRVRDTDSLHDILGRMTADVIREAERR